MERRRGDGDGSRDHYSGYPTPTLEELTLTPSPWLAAPGPHSDIVLSTRTRLARNMREYPFTQRAREEQLRSILSGMERAAQHCSAFDGSQFFQMQDLSTLDRLFLVERHLVSHELSDSTRPRGLLVAPGERVSVMVNEEDHIRLQSLVSGFHLGEAWRLADQADDELDATLEYAYHSEWGFLTACPTNTGTGLRASVLIHLPALVLTKEIDKVLKGVMQMGLAVRGFYGEGSEVVGNLFQISNQTTLGNDEKSALDSLERVTRQILGAEEKARETLLRDARIQIEDKVYRAYGSLRHGRSMSSQEVVNLSSAVRLGVALGFVNLPELKVLNELLVITLPAHLQRRLGTELKSDDRNVRRADFVRNYLASAADGADSAN
jgi:protein arginine kinase